MAAGAKFSLNLGKWAQQAKKDLDAVARLFFLDVFGTVVERTPVWEHRDSDGRPVITGGMARGNWQAAMDKMPTGTINVRDASGSVSKASIASVLSAGRVAGHVVWLANSTPYIGVLEYGGFPNPPKEGTGRTVNGFSTQAPAGMVRITVIERTAHMKKAISAARRAPLG